MAVRDVVPAVNNVGKGDDNLARQLVGAYNDLAISFNQLLTQVQAGTPDYTGIAEADTLTFKGESGTPS